MSRIALMSYYILTLMLIFISCGQPTQPISEPSIRPSSVISTTPSATSPTEAPPLSGSPNPSEPGPLISPSPEVSPSSESSIMTMNPGCPVSASGNLIKNGSFEEPKVTPPFAQQNLSFTSWNLSAGNVDIVENSHWQAGQGVQSLDLNGIDAGSLSQTISTSIPTKLYALRFRLSFCLAANPGGSEPAKLELIWNNTSMGTFTFDAQSQSAADMGWVNYTGVQTLPPGRRSVNTLMFRSLNTGSAGPVIDNVSLLLEN